MMSTRMLWRASLGLAAATVAVALLSACAPSPTTTTTDVEGNTVTVDWADYPAHAGIPANDVLILPKAEEVEARAAQLVAEVQNTLKTEYGITGWTTRNEAGWYPEEGNGYGGRSLLTTYNSASHEANVRIPVEQWDAVIETIRELMEQHEITHEAHETYFEEDPEWMRVGSFHRGTEFFDVAIEDNTLNPDHTAEESNDEPVTGVSLFYGITTISETDRNEFIRRTASFEGLKLPEATTSD